MSKPNKRSLLVIFFVLIFIVGTTIGITFFAKGYQISTKGKVSFLATGIISATSKPKGASVYIDDRLITATDDTINLPPNNYTIKIVKDGYLPWQKNIQVKKEIVYQTTTQLFRSSPDLRPITVAGAINPTISPNNSLVVFSVASASAAKDNGLYLLELSDTASFLSKNSAKQLSSNLQNLDWSKFTFTFSPNSKQILASNPTKGVNFLIDLSTTTDYKNLYDVTAKLSLIKEDWNLQEQEIIKTKTTLLPIELQPFVSTTSAKTIIFNEDETKVLYLAQADGNLKKDIITPPPAQSTQPQSRDIKKDNYYVYDFKDDTNFWLGSKDLYNLNWIANSNNLIFIEDQKIQTIEYDNTNKQTLFAGNFNKDAVYPWLDGSKIITLIAPYNNAQENLYSITIK
ncbi:MAG: PEGA domain-containing protein [Candidatus Shapirobacteria bacterium]|nr:PEGA domain-containing protein [Candidatus Shapirobacteria bacterium]MDD3002650.1 PEGA domain-containing protein [Candidatus Shapirobacteria bacterium]MDD4382831.1 PEGA domain-containing protein [Candidatus Shapirobacteria bacterium]